MVEEWLVQLQSSSGHEPWLFLVVFLMGLALNLTPCVYPMLFVTLSLFGGKDPSENKRCVFTKAVLYVLGIATMYSALGTSAATTGAFFGTVLQNRWVLAGIGAALFALSLSMFGLYTFRLPSGLINRVGGGKKAGLFGIYFSGLFVGIFAAPCIGPPVIALLAYVADRGDPVYAFFLFFVMSLGLGLPYLFLGIFSGAVKRLPKSGAWMVWFEHLFGAILAALAVFYFLAAFRPDWIPWLPFIALMFGAIGLGFIDRTEHAKKKFRWFKRIAGAVALVFGVLLFPVLRAEGVVWEPYTPGVLQTAADNKEPVILDFYADWCMPCHELDQFTYSDPHVIRALEGFRKIKVDVTRFPADPDIVDVVTRFDVPGVPVVLFLDSEGREIEGARLSGFVAPDEFLDVLYNLPPSNGQQA